MVQEKQIGKYSYSTGIGKGSKTKSLSSRARLLKPFNIFFSVAMDVSLNVLMPAKIISDNSEFPYLLTVAKVNVDFASCAEQPPKMFLNVPLIALMANKAVSILAMLERPNVLLAVFCKL